MGLRIVESICPYCGCACKLRYVVDESGRILSIKGCESDEISEGKPCIKGLTVHEIADKNRCKHAVIRKERSEVKVSLKRALEYIYENVKDFAPDEVFVCGSGKITNEDNWVMLKFAKIVLKTNNTDSCCGRLCHAATVQGFIDCFGCSNLTRMDYVKEIDTLFVIGSNPASNYPVFFNKVLRRRKEIKIISIQPVFNITSRFGDIFAYIEPGTEVVFLNALANYLIEHNLYEKSAEKIDGFRALCACVKGYDEKLVERICKMPKDVFYEIAEAIANAKSLGIFHGMGLTQHVNALENVHALANLVLLKNAKILSLRGEVNVQGVGDIGFLPKSLPTGGFETLPLLEELWGCELPMEKGKTIIDAFLFSPVKAAFITAFNPAQSMPALRRVHKNLENMFLVCCESYHTLTCEFADVLLPTPALFERKGTITNGERKIRVVTPVRAPLGEATQEWKIFCMLAKLFGKEKFFNYRDEIEVFREITKCVPAYSHISPEEVYSGRDVFAEKTSKYMRFHPEKFEGKDEIRSEKYPFILTTFRSRYQFLTGEMTSFSETLKKLDEGPCVYINPKDAHELEIKDGDAVKITSEAGSVIAKVKVSVNVPEKVVATRFHYRDLLVNTLVPAKVDEKTHTPSYKCVAVRVEKA